MDSRLEGIDTSGCQILVKRIFGMKNVIPIQETGVLRVSYITSDGKYTQKIAVVE